MIRAIADRGISLVIAFLLLTVLMFDLNAVFIDNVGSLIGTLIAAVVPALVTSYFVNLTKTEIVFFTLITAIAANLLHRTPLSGTVSVILLGSLAALIILWITDLLGLDIIKKVKKHREQKSNK